ncbi:MAG TPA: cytochrome c3 family protein, partial [Desulfosarcina sp.]|nr:cytochrome c3 family protein [Desulfosarcina sp.]
FGVRQRPPVVFNHEEHNEKAGVEECATCHHEGFDKDGAAIEGDPATECSECHMADGKDKMDLMRVYHLNCKGCHEAQKAGPVQCAECHDKNNVMQ